MASSFFAKDKLDHMVYSFTIFTVVYHLAVSFMIYPVILAAGITFFGGLVKELLIDLYLGKGCPDVYDMVSNTIGITVGILFVL